jgi:hypothetical protein
MHKILSREMMDGGRYAVAALSRSELGVKDLFYECFAELQAKGKLSGELPIELAILTVLAPAVYSCVAAPVLRAVYGLPPNDPAHARRLAVFLTHTIAEGWGKSVPYTCRTLHLGAKQRPQADC